MEKSVFLVFRIFLVYVPQRPQLLAVRETLKLKQISVCVNARQNNNKQSKFCTCCFNVLLFRLGEAMAPRKGS